MRPSAKTLFAALVAALAVTAVAAASASAEAPEFTPANGTFTGTGGHATIEEGTAKYACEGSTVSGRIVGPKEVANVVVKFNCTGFCQNHTWETRELKGRLGYLSKADKRVGLLLEPVTEPVATCQRFGGPATIQGSIIGAIGPLNTNQTGPFTVEYRESGAKQELQRFEGEELMHNLQILPAGHPTPTKLGLETNMTLTMQVAHEIRA